MTLGPNVPTSVEQWLNTRSPTTSPDRTASGQSETGSTAGTFNSTHDRDNMDPHIGNFFHRIDEAVWEVLRGETSPLVLAGVEYETSMYRDINSYPHLASGHVHGSPESLKGGELHKRALEVAHRAFAEPMNKALQQYEKLGGTDRVASKPAAIVKAARRRPGRIAVHRRRRSRCSQRGGLAQYGCTADSRPWGRRMGHGSPNGPWSRNRGGRLLSVVDYYVSYFVLLRRRKYSATASP